MVTSGGREPSQIEKNLKRDGSEDLISVPQPGSLTKIVKNSGPQGNSWGENPLKLKKILKGMVLKI